jgi:Tfp pilus assembly protein PilV
MMYILVAVLLLVVIIFSVSSTSQSYATAQQAKAQIETAQLGQINAWGNLFTILTLALIILVVLAVLVFALYWFFVRAKTHRNGRASVQRFPQGADSQLPRIDAGATISQLVQLETLKILRSMNATPGASPAVLDAPTEEDEIPWLR